ncbi:MAG TPA: radical SAM protein [Xanthobacteraceae bacterium]
MLLINPPWLSKDENIWNGVKSAMPPLGLLSIAAYVESRGYCVRVIDVHIEKYTAAELIEKLKVAQPKFVGMGVMTATSNAANQIARIVKSTVPNCTVVFGGVHPEAMPAETLCNSAVDIVVRGDGEETFLSILQGRPLGTIRGISYRKGATVVHNPSSIVEMNLDKYPFPAYHLVPMDKYYPAIGAYKRLPAINMLMTRGCPGKCTFCNSAMTTLRTRSAESVVEEIEYLNKTYGVREIQFYDDTFTVMKKNVMRFCELMAAKNLNVSWAAFVRADCFSEEMAHAMKKAGCHQILIGVESGSDIILKNIRKPIDRERTADAIKIARAAGLESRASFIFGSMGETVETMQETLDFSMQLDPDIAQYNVCTPYPGTQMYRWAKENGYLVSEEWGDFELSTFMMKLPTCTDQDVYRYYKNAHKQFYMRPKMILRRLRKVSRLSHIRDLIHAFFYIVLRKKLGTRGEVRRDWLGTRKHDFFDLNVSDARTPHLTFEVRQKEISLEPEELVSPIASRSPVPLPAA